MRLSLHESDREGDGNRPKTSDLQDDFTEEDDVGMSIELFEYTDFSDLMNFIHT